MELSPEAKLILPVPRDWIIKVLLFANFFLLFTSFNIFDFGGRNTLLLSFSVLSSLIMVASNPRSVPGNNSVLIVALYLFISFLLNLRDAKATSVLYSFFFLFNYWFLAEYFKKYVKSSEYNTILKAVFIIYFVVLIIGQIYVYLGYLSTFDKLGIGIVHGNFGTLYEVGKNSFRFYSLSTEPSVASFIVIILFYSITKSSVAGPFSRKKVPYWLILAYMIFFFQSGYGLILLTMLIAFYSLRTRHAIFAMLTTIIIIPLIFIFKTSAFDRVSSIIYQLDWSNIFTLSKIDYSASFRILPFFHYVHAIDLLDFHFYLGHGAGASIDFLIPLLFNVPVKTYEGGFLPQFLYDYGILIIPVLFIFLKREIAIRIFSLEFIILILMMTNANFNTQLFWLTIISFSLNKYYTVSSNTATPAINEKDKNLR
jgi:hypothetical protein